MEGGLQGHSVFMFHSLLSDTLVVMTIVLFRLVTARTVSQKTSRLCGFAFPSTRRQFIEWPPGEKTLNLLVDFSEGFYTPKIVLGVKPLSEVLYTDYKKYDE